VNFTNDTGGVKPNGFSSVDAPQISFFDTVGSGLFVDASPGQTHGNALILFSQGTTEKLEIRLAAPTTAMSLAFGNDDPALSDTSDMARLALFRGTTKVGQVDVNFNANDLMDQTVKTSGQRLFNRAEFQYVDAVGNPVPDIAEVIDDIKVNPLCTIVGNGGNNELVGGAGADVICGGGGKDTISGKRGTDLIYGGSGKDQVYGGRGGDVLKGGSGNDRLYGGKGNDQLAGGAGQDRCNGGRAQDTATSCEILSSVP
jgi:hypothetical protein